MADAVPRPLAIAAGGRPGPVLLDVPKDMQLAPVGQLVAVRRAQGASLPHLPST